MNSVENVKAQAANLKLDLACGLVPKEGFVGVDNSPNLDYHDRRKMIRHDLQRRPWPFRTNSVAEVWCSHYVEHTPDLIAFMDEIYRVLSIEGLATITAPFYTSVRAIQDPTHLRSISAETFFYFNKAWREAANIGHYNIKSDFDIIETKYILSEQWKDVTEKELNYAIWHFYNVVTDIIVTLKRRG